MMTRRNARYLGLADRGRIAPGLRADLNVIDPARLRCRTPRLVRDLPAGGKRFLQKAEGYVGTWVAGRPVQRDGELDAASGRAGWCGWGGADRRAESPREPDGRSSAGTFDRWQAGGRAAKCPLRRDRVPEP